ncbi:hypothetical protein EPUS_03733 [Endocarpon pusillum Z07020]|uniref:Uncharacterized protein n=1 Tax=Endocarpon pusillum (strain Z07020 / HMAS-L-300199) TaxID=1263415 RepID=U1HEC7_ENDPU|nr:uncharacterized protein EPUS_03733 [Endocarpon pusillum Z07020]ERF68415.1 hypothetical protein EPUS_03733 [Endocarpon pusillum Z07020]
MWHLFCLRYVPRERGTSHLNSNFSNLENLPQYSESIFAQWLKTNATFTVHGKTLEGWTKEQKVYLMPVLRVLDFLSAMPDFILLMLLMLIHCPPFIIMSIFLSGDKKIWLTLILSATFFGLVLGEFSWIRDFRGLTQHSKLLWGDWTRLVEPGKRLMVADKGFLGMVDDGAEKGDMLFYLVGCSPPVVLREVQGDRDGGRDRRRYEVVGKCYIHFTKKDQEEYLGSKAPRSPETASGRLRYERLKEEWVTKLKKKGAWEEIDSDLMTLFLARNRLDG